MGKIGLLGYPCLLLVVWYLLLPPSHALVARLAL